MEIPDKEIKLMFKGPDGKDYPTLESLALAEAVWRRERFSFRGDDGRSYKTFDKLCQANEAHFRETHFYIVFDEEKGRMEVRPGTGPIQVCVGHYPETDETGRQRYIPVYRTEIF